MVRRESGIRSGTTELDTPRGCSTEVFGDVLEQIIVDRRWSRSELGERSDRISDIDATDNVCIEEFTKECAIREAFVSLKGAMGVRLFGRSW